MSAANRRPYLGEDIHLVTRLREQKKCRPAIVTDIIEDRIEIYVFGRPVPYWKEDPPHDEEQRAIGSWHYSH